MASLTPAILRFKLPTVSYRWTTETVHDENDALVELRNAAASGLIEGSRKNPVAHAGLVMPSQRPTRLMAQRAKACHAAVSETRSLRGWIAAMARLELVGAVARRHPTFRYSRPDQ